jgi:3-hydroxybutyryl-CoA dehydrogenase
MGNGGYMRIAVIGAGVMGTGIAYTASLAGNSVVLNDCDSNILEKAHQQIRILGEKGIARGKIKRDEWENAINNLTKATDLKRAVEGVDLVIEAVTEDLKIKVDIFKSLDKLAPSQSVLASNTSSMSITEIAATTSRQGRVIGMHFFNPVHSMKLVEIVKGLETAQETVDHVASVIKSWGKEAVIINDSPGFGTSRLIVLMGNEAFYALMEGVASAEDIDKGMRLGYNHPMGPFELVDLVGLDTRLNILKYLHSTLGERFRPCPLLVKYVKAGRLGRKVGRGVYEYGPQGERLIKEVK